MADRIEEAVRERVEDWFDSDETVTDLTRHMLALVRREVEAAEERVLDWWFAASTLRELDHRTQTLTDHYFADEDGEREVYNDTAAAIRARSGGGE